MNPVVQALISFPSRVPVGTRWDEKRNARTNCLIGVPALKTTIDGRGLVAYANPPPINLVLNWTTG